MDKSISSDLIRGHIDTIILYSLMDCDKCAQDITTFIDEKSQKKYEINQATLYSSLKRLETMKVISSYWFDSPNGGRRKYFKITDSGKKLIQDNLDNWNFSKEIIDVLTDSKSKNQQQIIEKPVYIEKIVEKIVEVEKPIEVNKTVQVNQEKDDEKSQNTQSIDNKNSNVELNFRNVLTSILPTIKTKTNFDKIDENNAENTIKLDTIDADSKKDFLESIDNDVPTYNYNGSNLNIDYSDLISDSQKEGYKVRISTKETKISNNPVFINKVNFFASIFTLLFMGCQMLFACLFGWNFFNLTPIVIVITISAMCIIPLILLIIYMENKVKTSKKIAISSVWGGLIFLFDAIIVIFAIDWFCNVNFSDTYSFALYFLVPVLFMLDIFFYILCRYLLAKSNFCKNTNYKK